MPSPGKISHLLSWCLNPNVWLVLEKNFTIGCIPHSNPIPSLLAEYVKTLFRFPTSPHLTPTLGGWPLFLFHKPNGSHLKEVPQLFSPSLTNIPVPGSVASSFPPIVTGSIWFLNLITHLNTVFWLLYPLPSQGPYVIIITILSLLYPQSLPLNWIFPIGIYRSPVFNVTNALLKAISSSFTNRSCLCSLFHFQITS